LVTSDRDSFALIDETTSVLRVLNGGIDISPLLTPAKLPAVCGVRPAQYRDYAALRGDSSDNLLGARGIGGKTAARLLASFDSVDAAFTALDTGRADEVIAAIGPAATARLATTQARDPVSRNQRLMTMHAGLVLPPMTAMTIPVDGTRLRGAFLTRGIRLATSIWALVGEPAPDWHTEPSRYGAAGPLPAGLLSPTGSAPAEVVHAFASGGVQRGGPAVRVITRRRIRQWVTPGLLSLF
jgi:hypothetical protein